MTIHRDITMAVSPLANGTYQVFHIAHSDKPEKPPQLVAVGDPVPVSGLRAIADDLRKLATEFDRMAAP